MPIDVKALRERPEAVRSSEQRRFRDPDAVDVALVADADWREATKLVEALRGELARTQRDIGKRKKASSGSDACEELLQAKARLDAELAEAELSARAVAARRDAAVGALGNLLAEWVPTARGEDGNVVLRTWREATSSSSSSSPPSASPKPAPHWELFARLCACDFERGTKVAGRRGYFLRGHGVLLNMALQNYGVAFLARRGYTPLQPPYLMKKEVMARTAELADFDEQLYSVGAGRSARPRPSADKGEADKDGEAGEAPDLAGAYLIATSEQPLSALHQDESLPPTDLPLRYAGVSPCFRAETSARGLDAKGLFRVHQFEKVEQFCICSPEQSPELFEEMLKISEEFLQSLELPYRVVAIASGALNPAAAAKCDIEAWFPASGEHRELVSCSNCTDFQARALGVRLSEGPRSRHVHMLNATLCATERTLCCLLENHQEEAGVRVPSALVPYMQGLEFLPFSSLSSGPPAPTKGGRSK